MIERPIYLEKLIKAKDNGFPEAISGLRRCGKSFLISELYPVYLRSIRVPKPRKGKSGPFPFFGTRVES